MTRKCKMVLGLIPFLLSCALAGAQPNDTTGKALPNPSVEFLNAQAEHERIQSQQSNLSLRFRLEFYSAKKDKAGKPEDSKMNWDGENLLIDSDAFVYVSTPYRAFLLVRDSPTGPLSIQFISPISTTVRTVEEIIQFDLKVGDGYAAAARPTEMRRYYCQYGMFAPREDAFIERAVRTPDGLMRFDYQRTAKPEEFLVRESGSCTVDPTQGYALVSGQMNMVFKRPSINRALASQFEY